MDKINPNDYITEIELSKIYINKEEWHQLINETDEPLIIIEIQFGEKCDEDDIERLFYYE